MLELLTNYDLLVANGFVMGDLEGKETCCTWNGLSVNDVFIYHRNLSNAINYFKVNDNFEWYSDHRFITASLRVNMHKSNKLEHSWSKLLKRRMNWNSETIEKYKNILEQPDTVEKLENFIGSDFSDSDTATAAFSSVLNHILGKVFPKKNIYKKSNIRKRDHDHSPVVQTAKRIFRKAQRRFNYDKSNADRRHQFIIERRNYRQAIYAAKKIAKGNRMNNILDLEQLDTKAF